MNAYKSTGVLYIDNTLIKKGLDSNSLIIFSFIKSRSFSGKFSKSVCEVARATNTSPMTVKRTIKKLSENGLIKLNGNTVNRVIEIL